MAGCGHNEISGTVSIAEKLTPTQTLQQATVKANAAAIKGVQAALNAAVAAAACPASCRFINSLRMDSSMPTTECKVSKRGRFLVSVVTVTYNWKVTWVCNPHMTVQLPADWVQQLIQHKP